MEKQFATGFQCFLEKLANNMRNQKQDGRARQAGPPCCTPMHHRRPGEAIAPKFRTYRRPPDVYAELQGIGEPGSAWFRTGSPGRFCILFAKSGYMLKHAT